MPISWDKCNLRKWLNSEFLAAGFTSDEQSRILPTRLANNSGIATLDKIFVLSIDEVKQYFSRQEDRICKVTRYARSRGAAVNSEEEMLGLWWLRSRGTGSRADYYAAAVGYEGFIYGSTHLYAGLGVESNGAAIRPALWLKA